MQLDYLATVVGIIRSVKSNDAVHPTIQNLIVSTVMAAADHEIVNCKTHAISPTESNDYWEVRVTVTDINGSPIANFYSDEIRLKTGTVTSL